MSDIEQDIPFVESSFFDDSPDDLYNDLGAPTDYPSQIALLPDPTEVKLPDNQADAILAAPPQELSIKWSETPSIIDQFMLKPETCKPGPIVTRVFDLCDTSDLSTFNQIKERAFPEGAPQIVIMREEIVPFDAKATFKAILQYRPISYMVLTQF